MVLLGFQEGSGGGHSLSFLSFNAHSLALVVPPTDTLLHYTGSLSLIAVLPRVRGNARVRLKDGQVRGLAAVVLSAAIASFPYLR